MAFSKFTLVLYFSSFIIASAIEVSHDGRAITIDGKRRVLISGSIHYTRSTAEMWPSLIKKSKEGGLDAIETYVFWNAHERQRRQYDFSGDLDLIRFLKAIQNEGLYTILRIGPYICGEWNYGGFPLWLHNMPDIELRTANDVFMKEMQNFTTLIVNMVKNENLFASQGGNIILAQIENEYGNVIGAYGDPGKAYVQWCANMAESLNIGVPWIMCQESDAPKPIINTCNGWYCDNFSPNDPNSPKMWTENWTGWFKSWGGPDPFRTAEDLAYSVARFFQTGGTFQNYYMYHGGTNFGRTAGGPYITTTYDYNAPLDEYGNLNQPKYGHLKQLHDVLHSMETTLTHGDISNVYFAESVSGTIYTTNETSSCFIANINTTEDATILFQGTTHIIPAWSVSIFPDCEKEAYNTARVNTQTSIMVKEGSKDEDRNVSLKWSWSWRPEIIDGPVLKGRGDVQANRLIDQKRANDLSDYLWYMTNLNLDEKDPIFTGENMTLRVNATGHVLHAYVNGKYLGSKWAKYGIYSDVLETPVKLSPGDNLISLLSATVGFMNYGPKFDLVGAGIRGPIQLISKFGDERIIKDLSAHSWNYKVGLDGLKRMYYNSDSPGSTSKWASDSVPVNRNMTWYMTTFKAPAGTDPVVVDLLGLGKGEAWINGNSIGRYWPSYIADESACSGSGDVCDYRGPYSDSKCVSKCGEPTQRWYHVPRSFFQDGDNTLVLFEEFGGDPSKVNFKTVRAGTVCGNAYENRTLELSCQGHPISAVNFASFGDPAGSCGAFQKGNCEGENDALSILQKECVGKETCLIDVTEDKFGTSTCGNIVKRLAVEAVC
ncbi:hypothetical protein SLEP1_g34286 [Rubroshorea leprosula]|uniref:beta-galactosidase n=1 Tax=Rubroshorea leprosula TaxID=152421 RepID=A0AAV5KJE1_9ROSI|nr:hypothetical protein SLEP1_g34286 [Rubroshorea leprosula]